MLMTWREVRYPVAKRVGVEEPYRGTVPRIPTVPASLLRFSLHTVLYGYLQYRNL